MRRVRFKRIRDALVLALAVSFATTAAGCFGRFRAVNAVYDFNKSASPSPVVRSLLLFALVFIPVYELAFLADWIVLNVVDFLNGSNTVAVQTLPDGGKVELAKLDKDTVRVREVDAQGRESSFDIVRVGPDAGYVRDSSGHIVGSVERLSDGRLLQRATPRP
jgi:hypothetical protein